MNNSIITISTKEITEKSDQSYLNYIHEQLIEFIRNIIKQKKAKDLTIAEIHKLTAIPHPAIYSMISDEKYFSLSMSATLRCLNRLGYEIEITVSEKELLKCTN